VGEHSGAADEARRGAEEVPQGSVFGNLPDSRPGVRSPRRGRSRPTESETAEPAPDREAAAAAGAQAEDPYEPPAPEPDDDAGARGPSGIEDVAWAGIAAAAEAATIGVRIANRAFEALRDTVDRR
jgi:hypothetical protein